jgi:(1->4)-alpha-D-glucan 1-alpha-D-glucosylmutase
MQAYMLKVVREAKVRTSWTSPAADYEAMVTGFVEAALSNPEFLADHHRRSAPLRLAGALNSLTQLAIKLAAPGVPDIYQGTEFWDLSLVDPDNRRPVDFAARRSSLEAIDAAGPETLLTDWRSGQAKMRLLKGGLAFRRRKQELFAEGGYVPLEANGPEADRIVAFARRRGADWLILVATRLGLSLLDGDVPLVPPTRWSETKILLPDEAQSLPLRDILFAGEIAGGPALDGATVLARFPVALLHAGAESGR